MNQHILIYLQDIGGAKFIAPTIDQILGKYKTSVVVHPISEAVFKKHKIKYLPLSHFFNTIPPSEGEIKSFLLKNGFSHAFCSLSSPYRDLTNSNLIELCRELKIPTFGIMDHWKGYDRFFDSNREMIYFPEYLGCIDEFSKKEILKYCNDPEKIFIVGHPYLEKLLAKKDALRKEDRTINMLIISQPDTSDRDFLSIFQKTDPDEQIIEKIYEQTVNAGKSIKVYFRHHPKETKFHSLPEGIIVDKTEDWEDALRNNDIFIGLDSMMLIEAELVGKQCITLNIPEFSDFHNSSVPYDIGSSIKKLNDFEPALQNAIRMIGRQNPDNSSDLKKKISGSSERVVHYLERFINNTEKSRMHETV